ncbi:MAG: PA2779 family protein [Nitrospirae bacterium]|nr:PA2779 family protein [Nitrospirota bacterium]
MIRKSLAWYLVFALFVISVVPRAEGAFSPSQAIVLSDVQRQSDLGKIRAFLESKLVSQRLQDLGFSADEVKERLAIMSDQQLHAYAQQLDDLRAGGDDGLGAVIAVLIIILLIVLILHLTGHKVIVK